MIRIVVMNCSFVYNVDDDDDDGDGDNDGGNQKLERQKHLGSRNNGKPGRKKKNNDNKKDENLPTNENDLCNEIKSKIDQFELALDLWRHLGNSNSPHQNITFSFVTSMQNSRSKKRKGRKDRRRKHSIQEKLIIDVITSKLKAQFGWNEARTKDGKPTLSFHLVHENSGYFFSLELVALIRTFPLREFSNGGSSLNESSLIRSKKRRVQKKSKNYNYKYNLNVKRIASFFLVRSLYIQQGDKILDPICGRGHFLVEAAKYWPSASYYGVDTSIPHLEHAEMNSKSTNTCLQLFLRRQAKIGGDKNHGTSNFLHFFPDQYVDKIVSCLPFKKSESYYQELLQEYSRILNTENGKMALIIDQPSLDLVIRTIDEYIENCFVSFVRYPAITYGKQKVVAIVVRKEEKKRDEKGNLVIPAKYDCGKFSWEIDDHEASKRADPSIQTMNQNDDQLVWSNIRERTFPLLVPYSKDRRKKRTSILLSPTIESI